MLLLTFQKGANYAVCQRIYFVITVANTKGHINFLYCLIVFPNDNSLQNNPSIGNPLLLEALGQDKDHNNTEEAALAQAIIFSNET